MEKTNSIKKNKIDVLLIPAWNEEKYCETIFKTAKEWEKKDKKHRKAIVINDGSTDKTKEKAKKIGIRIIDSAPNGQNVGKTKAFERGLFHAAAKYGKENIKNIITMDADLLNVKVKDIERIQKYSKLNIMKGKMILFRTGATPTHLTGERLIPIQYLNPLLEGNLKWKNYFSLGKYSIEEILNTLIGIRKTAQANMTHIRKAKDGKHFSLTEISKDIIKPRHHTTGRKTRAKNLWKKRHEEKKKKEQRKKNEEQKKSTEEARKKILREKAILKIRELIKIKEKRKIRMQNRIKRK